MMFWSSRREKIEKEMEKRSIEFREEHEKDKKQKALNKKKNDRALKAFVKKHDLKPGDTVEYKFYDYTYMGLREEGNEFSCLEIYNPHYKEDKVDIYHTHPYQEGRGNLKDLIVKELSVGSMIDER